jgi:3-hydroxymyristoyl/3-hydroxydecanoyl-(acyl carrier protein) dehydratase
MQARAGLPIAADHPAFAGHFPGAPIVPGVVLLDETLRALSSLCGVPLGCCTIREAKFRSVLRPGEPLALEVSERADGALAFVLTSGGGRTVATGTVVPDPPHEAARGV